jgi:hypothetical protein
MLGQGCYMEDNFNSMTTCPVCDGKGGWKLSPKTPFESNWSECHYCNSLGFVFDDTDEKSKSFLLEYSSYKKRIVELLSDHICQVTSYTTDDMGKKIKLKVVPFSKEVFARFTDFVLRLGHFSKNINISVAQVYFFKERDQKCYHHWEIRLEPDMITDLDGFVDIIRLWDKQVV